MHACALLWWRRCSQCRDEDTDPRHRAKNPIFGANGGSWSRLAVSLVLVVVIAVGTIAGLTFIAEAIALGIQANVSPLRVLQAAFVFNVIRPGWLVLGAGLTVVALDLVCARFAKQRRAARRVERALVA